MSEQGYERKRSLRDSYIDLSNVTIELNNSIDVLKAEFNMKRKYRNIWEQILVLEDMINDADKAHMTFSTVTLGDLERVGVVGEFLYINPVKLAEAMTTNTAAVVSDLRSRLKKIYASVNIAYTPRMILDAILLAVAEIASLEQRKVVILQGMRIPAESGEVQITHPDSGCLLLGPRGSRHAYTFSKSCLLLVEAKHESPEQDLVSYIPEAVGQAVALLKTANLPEVRFCLSDGQSWMFFVLKLEDGTLTYYESETRRLDEHDIKFSDMRLCETVQIIGEWLRPTVADLLEWMREVSEQQRHLGRKNARTWAHAECDG